MTDADDSSPRLEENSHLLKPPINNYCVYNEGFTVMVSLTHVPHLPHDIRVINSTYTV